MIITDEMVSLACEIYAEVYRNDDKDMGDAMRAALTEVGVPAQRAPDVFEIAMHALRVGAPGLSDPIRQSIARSITLRLDAALTSATHSLSQTLQDTEKPANEPALTSTERGAAE